MCRTREPGPPGGACLDPALAQPSGATFWEIMDSTADLLRQVFRTENGATLLLPATGMAGMETMFANLIGPGDKALIGYSGHFGPLIWWRSRPARGLRLLRF